MKDEELKQIFTDFVNQYDKMKQNNLKRERELHSTPFYPNKKLGTLELDSETLLFARRQCGAYTDEEILQLIHARNADTEQELQDLIQLGNIFAEMKLNKRLTV